MSEIKLYIQVENGQPINHPAFEENLIQAFGGVPNGWEPFVRIQNPKIANPRIKLLSQEPSYQKINGVWQDVWDYVELTVQEFRQFVFPKNFVSNFDAWVFDESKNVFLPPVPRPEDGKFYRWSGPDNNWKEAEPFPQDGKRYYFDFDNWVNVEITNV